MATDPPQAENLGFWVARFQKLRRKRPLTAALHEAEHGPAVNEGPPLEKLKHEVMK